MKRKVKFRSLSRVVIIVINFMMVLSVLFLMNYVKNLLYSDVRINLQEIVTQNKDVISSKLGRELNNLQLVSTQISDWLRLDYDNSPDKTEEVFKRYFEEDSTTSVFLAQPDGKASFPDGRQVDISGRSYFKLAMDGIQNISDRVVSRLDGSSIFVLSVPLYLNDEIIGTVQRQYSPEEIYKLCELSLFSAQGNMFIINSEGYILVNSINGEYSRESDNYFRMLYANQNQEASKKLERDIQSNLSGFMEISMGETRFFSTYTPLDDIHDWYLITSIATTAVSRNASVVIAMFYSILIGIVIISGISLALFLSYKNKQRLQLEKIAFIDSVTGGDTYNKFELDLREALENKSNQEYSLLVFDLDNFKYINGFYGFKFGNKVLFHIYKMVKNSLHANERLARISGDHFVVFMEGTDIQRVNAILDSISEAEGVKLYVSAGLYLIPERAESVNLMIDKATTAAREVKSIQNKRLGLYSQEHEKQMVRNEQVKRSMEEALADKEIIPYYQPKVNVLTGEVIGAEALARWMKKDGELVPPFQFIPVCEKTGLITELDMAIFEQVLGFLRDRLEKGLHCVKISVNFSRLHLLDQEFLNRVVEKIETYNVPSSLVELELTESIIFNNPNTISSFIYEIHKHGLTVSMDDFGSGHSSLGMLRELDVDVLKMDRSFIIDTEYGSKQKIIFEAVANMANKLNMDVVVEGVETEENVNLMKQYGCFVAQGYYYARPMSQDEFSKVCEERFLR